MKKNEKPTRKRSFGRLLTIVLSLLFGALSSACLFLWLASGEIYDYQDTFSLERDASQVDVVLCLAGGKGRIPVAVTLWEQLRAISGRQRTPVLFFSGVGPHAGFETLIDQGVSKESVQGMKNQDVVFENVSANTYENAQIFSSFARQNQWKNILLITASYHMRRSSDIMRKALEPDVSLETFTVDAEHFDRREWHKDAYAIRVTMMEYIKWLFYRYSY